MLTFEELRTRLVEDLRSRVRNGEITERRLARVTGISQPHVHNLLKGIRALTPDLGDQILKALHISLSDFLESQGGAATATESQQANATCRYINVLDGVIGPSHPWPSQINTTARLKLTDPATIHLMNPVAACVGEDVRMAGVFSKNDMAVLDQSVEARSGVDPDGLYLLKAGACGVIRRCRLSSLALYVFAEDCQSRPGAWQRIPLSAVPLPKTLRARVIFPTVSDHWDTLVA